MASLPLLPDTPAGLVGIARHDRRGAGEARRHVARDLCGRQARRGGTEILDPTVAAEIDARLRLLSDAVTHLLQLIIDEPELPGVEAIGAGVDVFGERALELRGRRLREHGERGQLLARVLRCGRCHSEEQPPPRPVQRSGERKRASAGGLRVEAGDAR